MKDSLKSHLVRSSISSHDADHSQTQRQPLWSLNLRGEMFPRSRGRGSIEARSTVKGRNLFTPCFHVREDVAPLKRAASSAAARGFQRFHVREDVAPLKRMWLWRNIWSKLTFPRSRGRGSIEASCCMLCGLTWSGFPRSRGRGSIEASCCHALRPHMVRVSTFERTWLH